MPKVNPTLLDRLISEGKIVSRKPEIIQATTIRDPLGYSMVQRHYGTKYGNRKNLNMTPEREIYQKGIDVQYGKKLNKFDEDLADADYNLQRLSEQYADDFGEAQDALADDMADWARNQLSHEYTDPEYVEDVVRNEMPNYRLSDYWEGEYSLPEYQEKFDDFNEVRDEAADARYDWVRHGRQQLQTRSPRYRRYQEAMQQRAANKRYGHMIAREEAKRRQLDAYVRDMLRSGMTMEDVRRELGAVRDAVPGSQNYDDLRQSYGPNWNGLKRTLRGER